MKGTTVFSGAAITALAVTGVATAGNVVFDQIGPDDGSNFVGAVTPASQYFEDAFAIYSIAALDDFTLDSDWKITSVEGVITGFNGYAGIAGTEGFQVNIYSSVEMAALNLVGDVFSQDFAAADNVTNVSDIVDIAQFNVNIDLAAGTYFLSVIPVNQFLVNGQSAIMDTDLGDGMSWQANPGGGFGMVDNMQDVAVNLGYRLTAIPAPGALALLGIAGLVTTRRRRR